MFCDVVVVAAAVSMMRDDAPLLLPLPTTSYRTKIRACCWTVVRSASHARSALFLSCFESSYVLNVINMKDRYKPYYEEFF